MSHAFSLICFAPKKARPEVWATTVDGLLGRVLTPTRIRVQGWAGDRRDDLSPFVLDEGTCFWRTNLDFRRDKPASDAVVGRQWASLHADAAKHARNTSFGGAPLAVVARDYAPPHAGPVVATPLHRVTVPEILVTGADEEVEAHPAAVGLYGRGPQIRLGLVALRAAAQSGLAGRTHILYHGPPGSGKSALLGVWKRLLPPTAYVEIDAPATTRAGLEHLFLETYRDRPPQVLLCEEIDRAADDLLESLLPLLDDRREVRTVTFRDGIRVAPVDLVCAATANDWGGLRRRLGERLADRFQPIYTPRPTTEELLRILRREVARYPGGHEGWVQAVLALARERGVTNTREILRWLAGGEQLVQGRYAEDLRRLRRAEEEATRGTKPPLTGMRYAVNLRPNNGDSQ